MKKQLAVIALAVGLVGAYTVSSQAYNPVTGQKQQLTAGVTTLGTKMASVSVKVRDVSNPAGPDRLSIGWTNVVVPGDSWKIADQLLMINATVTDANGGVLIYTDNTDKTAGVYYTGLGDPAGLLEVGSSAATVSPAIPMAWSIKPSSMVVTGTTPELGAADPNEGKKTGIANRYQWLFVLDKSTSSIFATDSIKRTYATAVNVGGIHFGGDASEFTGFPDGENAYMYLEADFRFAGAQATYRTDRLTLEAYVE